KEKIKVVGGGKPPFALGFMPIAGEEFVYEMTMKCLLPPGANGVPVWLPENPGEKQMVKLPEQFREIFSKDGELVQRQLYESIGQRLAQWSAGTLDVEATAEALVVTFEGCTADQFAALEKQRDDIWPKLPPGELKKRLQEAAHSAKRRF